MSQRERLRDVVRAAVTAEELGFAWYTVGEHHFGERDVIPSPVVILAAIAERTSSIRLATGTTLVANRDPVLVAEDYALLDLLSDGRLELIAGGSFFPEPYAVFGQEPDSAPWAGNLTEDGFFLPPERLRLRYRELGVDDGTEVAVYCGSGVTACHDLLALELAGVGSAALYPGSWSAWSADPRRPAVRGERPWPHDQEEARA
ncbi:LLM class flavin-dependent oxidoreductase [Microbispora hainanensis]|uniref:LLM class flavin-dependent oxidoreductase n=1 Tax=Microbispora hainanensis TaxID=568844 RepID=UPI003F541A0C